jgi:hypothetical protein
MSREQGSLVVYSGIVFHELDKVFPPGMHDQESMAFLHGSPIWLYPYC